MDAADICPRTPQFQSESGIRPLSRTPCITRDFTYVSARAANPRDEIREPRDEIPRGENAAGLFAAVSLPRVSLHVLKLKTVTSLGKDYAIPANVKLPPSAPDPVTHFSFQFALRSITRTSRY